MGLILSAQDAVGRNFTMQVGSIIQSVTLTASGENVNISPAVGTVVNQQFVQNLPLNGRSFQSLIGLTPGVVFVPTRGTRRALVSSASTGSAPTRTTSPWTA